MNEKNRREYYRGCLLGGSIGDALGYPIEFSSYWEIKRTYGSNGLQTMVLDDKGKGLISDDTQMMLFTVEGLMNAERDQTDHKTALYEAYLRWLYTQDYTIDDRLMTGSLISKGIDCPAGARQYLSVCLGLRSDGREKHPPERLQGQWCCHADGPHRLVLCREQ